MLGNSVLRSDQIVYQIECAFIVRYLGSLYPLSPPEQERKDFEPDRVILEAKGLCAANLTIRPAKQCMGNAFVPPINSLSSCDLLAIH